MTSAVSCLTPGNPDVQLAVDAFENDIALAAERLKAEGKTGLILLPGVQALLTEVCPAVCL